MNVIPGSGPNDWLGEYPPARSLALDQEAQRIYERAYAIGLVTEPETDPPITFSTVALALLEGEDETSRWFAREAVRNGPNAAKVRAEKKFDPSAMAPPSVGRPTDLRLSGDRQLLTASARSVLETAEDWANRVGGSDIGVRHLLATYVINPPAAHRRQMQEWGFDEVGWRQAFFSWVAPHYTAEAWNDVSQRAAPTKPVAAFEKTLVKGAALALPGDEQTMSVLDLAANYHARRGEGWLRLQTVLFALAERARIDKSVRDSIEPIWQAIFSVEKTFFAQLQSYVEGPAPLAGAASFDSLNISPRVLNALETARELAFATGKGAPRVGVLHLAAALVSSRVDNDADLASLRLDASALRQRLIEHAMKKGQNADIWRDALGEEEATPSSRPVDLNSDEPEAEIRSDPDWKSDPLGIRPDVHSFAALLASRSLEPPLSVGLFGPWGSGKTTFLKRLRQVVDQRATEARATTKAGATSSYVSNIVHVEFNAWHFAEDALVSSLIDTIVRELRAFIKDDYPVIGKQLLDLRARTAESAHRVVEEAKSKELSARCDVSAQALAVTRSEEEARESLVSLGEALQAVWKQTVSVATTSPIVRESGVLDQIGSTVKDATDLQQRIMAVRSRSAPLLGALGWTGSLGFAFMVLVLPPIVAWLVHRFAGLDGIPQALSTVVAVLSPVGLWLRTASGAASKVEAAIAKVVSEYEQQLETNEGVKKAKASLQTAKQNAAEASAALTEAERALQAATAAAASASLPSQVLTLTTSRVDSAVYAQELTTISIARSDLQTLSRILRDQVQSETSESRPADVSATTLRPVERVILYVDDLDRCSPQQVVRVLQIAHMLLAFELFVVVVAVDARWVEESLKTNYHWLSSAEDTARGDQSTGPVTPQDYLEKIFQISFWLEPMTTGRAATFLKSLTRPQRANVEALERSERAVSGTGLADFGRIDIGAIELDYMRALAAFVGPSPRRVKRLVNAYRLLKARMSDAQLAAFITDRSTEGGDTRSGPYQLVIGLLVIGTGAHGTGARILKDLAERDPRDTFELVVAEYRERAQADWTTAARVLETLMRTQKAADVAELRGWARRVGRFLLQGPREVVPAAQHGDASARS